MTKTSEILMERSNEQLKPYLILSETADKIAFENLLKEKGVQVAFEWRYYYGYKDAIRIIDFVETKGIYDAWVVFFAEKAMNIADELVNEYPNQWSYFDRAEEQFLRGLEPSVLIKTLASQQMVGISLGLAKKILKEQQVIFSDQEIASFKQALLIENNKRQVRLGRTKVLIWLLLIGVGVLYLWIVGFVM